MAADVVNLGTVSVNKAHVTHVEYDGSGGAKVFVAGGAVVQVFGDEADEVAKAFGRHDAKHLTAKEAKAEEKVAKAEEKAHTHK